MFELTTRTSGLDLTALVQETTTEAIEEAARAVRLIERSLTGGQLHGEPWTPPVRPQSHPLGIRTGRLLQSLADPGHPDHSEQTEG